MTVQASLVMELRQRTGAGMMECKKFLVQTNGDIEQAVIEMRKSGQAKADKKADRLAAEGIIIVAASQDAKRAVIVEVNSETDFVARDEHFSSFATEAASTALATEVNDVATLLTKPIANKKETIEDARQQLVAKIGENIQIRRISTLTSSGVIGSYLHGTKIGVLVAIDTNDEGLAKNIAMHIAANKPVVISRSEVSQELLAQEREIFIAQASESGKPKEIIEKMVNGRLDKYVDEVSLLGQPYVKDPSKKIEQLLKEHQATVTSFVRFEVGEGIEKKEVNFAEEVMAQVREQ